MLIYKIIGIGITGAVLSLLVKQYRPDFAIALPVLVSIVIFMACAPYIDGITEMLWDISENAGIEMSKVGIIIKIIGVSYICQFASDICTDAGEKTIAGKIELGGKLVIIVLSMPIIYNLLDLVGEIINF